MELGEETFARRYCIEGRVQGVGFRWFVHREASALQMRGWVRNTHANTVEVVAAGTASQLAQLRTAMEQGPRGSRVDRVTEEPFFPSQAAPLEAFKIEGAI